MAYMNQQRKAALAPAIRQICAKHGVKATLAVRNHSTLVLNIKAGKIDFINDYSTDIETRDNAAKWGIQVNPYHYKSHFNGVAQRFLGEVIPAMNTGNHDRSDIQTDYFDVGWYVAVNIGQYNKPYMLENSRRSNLVAG